MISPGGFVVNGCGPNCCPLAGFTAPPGELIGNKIRRA